LGCQHDADEPVPGWLQPRVAFKQVMFSYLAVELAHVFQLAPSKFIPGGQTVSNFFQGVAAPLLHPNEPISRPVSAIAIEAVDEGVQQLDIDPSCGGRRRTVDTPALRRVVS
jgi:hypothetical protein